MQGNLQEIDINSLLYFFTEQNSSGSLFIETNQELYFILFHQGEVTFAGDNNSFGINRLEEYLSYYQLDTYLFFLGKHIKPSASLSEYETILLLVKENIISPAQQKQITLKIIQEVLFHIITLKEGKFIWSKNFNLQPLILKIPLFEILPSVTKNIYKWLQLKPEIKSPFQCPKITDDPELAILVKQSLDVSWCDRIDGKTSFLQLSRYGNQSLEEIGKIIHSHIVKGGIQIVENLKEDNKEINGKENLIKICYLSNDQKSILKINNRLNPEKYKILTAFKNEEVLSHIIHQSINLVVLESKADIAQDKLIKMIRSIDDVPIIILVEKYIFKHYINSQKDGINEYVLKYKFYQNIFKILDKYKSHL